MSITSKHRTSSYSLSEIMAPNRNREERNSRYPTPVAGKISADCKRGNYGKCAMKDCSHQAHRRLT